MMAVLSHLVFGRLLWLIDKVFKPLADHVLAKSTCVLQTLALAHVFPRFGVNLEESVTT